MASFVGATKMKSKYKVHRFDLKMTQDHKRLEEFLNSLKGEIVSVIPNTETLFLFYGAKTNFVLVVEKVK